MKCNPNSLLWTWLFPLWIFFYFFFILYLFFFSLSFISVQSVLFFSQSFLVLELSSNLCHLIYLRNFFLLSLRLNRGRAVNWERRGHNLRQLLHFLLPLHMVVLSWNASSNRNVSFDFCPYIEKATETEWMRERERQGRVCLSYVSWHMSSKYYATVRSLYVIKVKK